jgi:hypothetical protein
MSRSLGHTLPDRLMSRLDGARADAGQAVVLATVDAAGRPHFALLSTAEIVALGPQTLRFGTYATSTTAGNLRDRGTIGLCLVEGGEVFYVKGRVQELSGVAGHTGIARFELTVEDVLLDAPSAEEGEAAILSGITFRRAHPVPPLGDMLRA